MEEDIDRKSFLKKLAVLGLATMVSDLNPVFYNDDYYVNQRVGIIIKKPTGWHYVNSARFEELYGKKNLLCAFAKGSKGDDNYSEQAHLIVEGYESDFKKKTLDVFIRFNMQVKKVSQFEQLPGYESNGPKTYQLNGFYVTEEEAFFLNELQEKRMINVLNFTPNNFAYGVDITFTAPAHLANNIRKDYEFLKNNVILG